MTQCCSKRKQDQRHRRWNQAAEALTSEVVQLAVEGETVRAAKLQSRIFQISHLLGSDARAQLAGVLAELWERLERIEAMDQEEEGDGTPETLHG